MEPRWAPSAPLLPWWPTLIVSGNCSRSFALLAIVFVLPPLAPAAAAPPTVYITEIENGTPPGGPLLIPSGVASTLHLYIDGGTTPSDEIRCAEGTGDEVCAWDLALQGQNGLVISGFAPEGGVVFYLSGSTLGLNGGDPWFGTLGPWKLGEISVQGTEGGILDLLPSQSVNSSLGLESIPPNTLVNLPEPGLVPSLLSSGAMLAWLTRRRRRQDRGDLRPGGEAERVG